MDLHKISAQMAANPSQTSSLKTSRLGLLAVFLLFLLAVAAAWLFLPNLLGSDWILAFRPASEAVLAGKNPYSVDQFLVAPWALTLFVPLSFLPDALAMAILRVAGLVVFGYAAIRLKASPIGVGALLLSPQVIHCLLNGNIDWLVMLGFVFPPQIGLFFLAIKPQLGVAVVVYWAVEAFRKKELVKTFAPFTILLLLSFAIFGLWPLNFGSVQAAYNASAWPISLLFGLVMLVMSLRRQNVRLAQGISPLFSPHVMFHSWVTVLYALAPDTVELVVAAAASWVVIGIAAAR